MPPHPVHSVKPGENVIFHCLAESYGDLHYQWKRHGNSFLPPNAFLPSNAVVAYSDDNSHDISTYKLVLSNVQKVHQGNYCCVATNECGDTTACCLLKVIRKLKIMLLCS